MFLPGFFHNRFPQVGFEPWLQRPYSGGFKPFNPGHIMRPVYQGDMSNGPPVLHGPPLPPIFDPGNPMPPVYAPPSYGPSTGGQFGAIHPGIPPLADRSHIPF